MPTGCLTEDQVARFVEHAVDDAERQRIGAHVDQCEECRRLVGAAAAVFLSMTLPAAGPPGDTGGLPAGVRLGRYVVLERLGAGAMGVVYSAYDPELDRRVAVKLVRAEAERGESSAGARGRRLTEAQTVARLNHPSVITVYDVGTVGDRVFIAMELVDGGTLAAWRAERPRSRGEILELFLRAGEGLAAAHDAGVVHRDFKPDNVLGGKDGRLRVTDFGLARAAKPGANAVPTVEIVGTPAYMSPEQFRGEPADARADQFAFCVALLCYNILSLVQAALRAAFDRRRRGRHADHGPGGIPPHRAQGTV